MYYVIQHRHNDPKKYFSAFVVPKFITSKENENVIFEFRMPDGSIKRKWTAKQEIILLTDDEQLFKQVIAKLSITQNKHLAQIKDAEAHLKQEFEAFKAAMKEEFEELEKQKVALGINCILQSYE